MVAKGHGQEWGECNGCSFIYKEMRSLFGYGNILYVDCISVSILVLILYYSFARWYH